MALTAQYGGTAGPISTVVPSPDGSVFERVPLAPDKVEGPAQVLSFLGIELDCGRLEARLPDTKLQDLRTLLDQYVNRGDMTQRELDSLLGKLSFAARVIIPGRTFMRRLWDICHRYSQPHYKIKLSVEALEDLKWWQRLLSQWNGKSFFHMPNWTPSPDIQLFTDASGSIGWGACYGHRWIQGQWLPEQADYSIEWKEMFAIAAACSSWGLEWRKLRIIVYCDNEAVVACLSNGCSRSPPVMDLIRRLFFMCANFGFILSAKHIPGCTNKAADALSRFNMQAFREAVPGARATADLFQSF
ncbi:uncharacterized protein LOC135813415 [Sycon ciliatum]|uniref:uncharacterized protein LOC135813415 n=1 Tax=Sycon ciliatum TaxID=27933 RepID=UPI0031F6593B